MATGRMRDARRRKEERDKKKKKKYWFGGAFRTAKSIGAERKANAEKRKKELKDDDKVGRSSPKSGDKDVAAKRRVDRARVRVKRAGEASDSRARKKDSDASYRPVKPKAKTTPKATPPAKPRSSTGGGKSSKPSTKVAKASRTDKTDDRRSSRTKSTEKSRKGTLRSWVRRNFKQSQRGRKTKGFRRWQDRDK